MTLHMAKGLEFPLVAIMGMEEGIFPHSRAFENDDALEEERRLCYVGMTRAKERLLLTRAASRRRYAGNLPERMPPSRFLGEVPPALLEHASGSLEGGVWEEETSWDRTKEWSEPGLDLLAERHEVRQIAESRLLEAVAKRREGGYSGETYNSVDNLSKFFAKRGIDFDPSGRGARSAPGTASAAGAPAAGPQSPRQGQLLWAESSPAASGQPSARSANTSYPPRAAAPPKRRFVSRPVVRAGPFRPGSKVRHSKFGVGTVMRLEGEGDNQKLSVLFHGHGLKKMMTKFAGLEPA
jgi:DNA helicase-2/ATP-dependent DNA helicase PcrA